MIRIFLVVGIVIIIALIAFLFLFNIKAEPSSTPVFQEKPIIIKEIVNEESFIQKVKEAVEKNRNETPSSSSSSQINNPALSCLPQTSQESCEDPRSFKSEPNNCHWFENINSCYANCAYIKDQTTCEKYSSECVWFQSYSYPSTGSCWVK